MMRSEHRKLERDVVPLRVRSSDRDKPDESSMGKKWTPGPYPHAPSAALTIPSGHLVRTSLLLFQSTACHASSAIYRQR
eukprot:scaffold41883_cov477-Skeletonema_dohrnii-CCMP3373.AAC.1